MAALTEATNTGEEGRSPTRPKPAKKVRKLPSFFKPIHKPNHLERGVEAGPAIKSGSVLSGDKQLPPWHLSTQSPAGQQQKVPVPSQPGNMRVSCPDLPTLDFRNHGRMVYAMTAAEVEHVCAELLHQGISATGWDLEWRTTFRSGEPPRKTALMQICYQSATGEYICLLLHIFHTGLPASLIAFLSNPDTLKIGVNSRGDAHKLYRDFEVAVQGVSDLMDHPVVRVDCASLSKSLASLTERYMQHRMVKGSQQLSNWETRPLAKDQLAYAATDALASLRIYQILQTMPQPVQPERPAEVPAHKEVSPPGTAVESVWIPAAPDLDRLQPAKLAVYKLLTEERMGLTQVAQRQQIQETTVAVYLAEAIVAGYGYTWPLLSVPPASIPPLATLAKQLLALAGADLACKDVAHALQLAGVGMRAIQNQLGDLTYGQIRLGLAHIGRQGLFFSK